VKLVFGWALLMFFTTLATLWLRGLFALLPGGEWHGLYSGLFVAVTWPSLAWSLRRFASYHLVELFSLPCLL